VPHPDRSLTWWAQTRNKRSVTLALETTEGRALFQRLAAGAHFVIESDHPGAMAARGLGADALLAEHPGLVYVSITPFGQTGPKAALADSDLVLLAAGGPLLLTGDDDRPPVRLPVPQAYLHAGAEAAVGALIAHHERQRSGRGQHVDVSAQQAVALATQSYILCAAVGAPQVRRLAGGIKHGGFTLRFVFPARDGHVAIAFLFGSAIGPFARRLMEWVHEEGFCDAATRDKDWIRYGDLLLSGAEPLEEFERVKACIDACTRSPSPAASSSHRGRRWTRSSRAPSSPRETTGSRSNIPSSAAPSSIPVRSRGSRRLRSATAVARQPSASTTPRSTATSSAS